MTTLFHDIDLSPSLVPATTGQNVAIDPLPERSYTRAKTDSELAREYLHYADLAPKSLANTQKELYRFLLWCELEAQLPLRALMPADLEAYKAFLVAPPSHWVNKRKLPRSHPEYRPFSGDLSDSSRRQAIVALKSFLSFAADRKYLELDIGALVKNVKKTVQTTERYLSEKEIAIAIAAVDARGATSPKAILMRERDRFLLIAYYYTGARLSELSKASMKAFSLRDDRWRLSVLGKGSKPRNLHVHPDLLDAYVRYREAFGLTPYPSDDESLPLILSTRGKTLIAITDESAAASLKRVFSEAAQFAIANKSPISVANFKQATTHWLRHSMISHAANNGVGLKVLQDEAGHANIATTSIYLHKSETDRHDELKDAKDRQLKEQMKWKKLAQSAE